ncbi:CoA-binding protein [Candidatus Bathyarchaeota archaeon]|nr:CoA-binding protein [Candidatus Bathyarchaeota archaeon]
MRDEAIKAIFEPESIAIVGASRDPEKVGYLILKNLVQTGFKGNLYPVNPKVREILGLNSYSSVEEISESVDLAVIVVPAPTVPEVLKQCGRKKVKSAVVISGGFRETGKEGEELEKILIQIIRETGIRLVGPNCIGVDNPHIGMSMWVGVKKKGPIGIVTQSGLVGTALECWAEKEGIGVSKCVSLGNKVDVDEIDLLRYLADDENTRAIAIYVEGIDHGREFIQAASEVSRKKPIIALKGGRSKLGVRAASSHTRSLSGRAEVYEAAFRKSGILTANSLEELYDFAKALSFLPLPKGRGALVVTSSGGAGILASDLADKIRLELPSISERAEKRLRQLLPSHCVFSNPFDVTTTTSEAFQLVMEENVADEEINAFMPIFADPLPRAAEAVKRIVEKTDKPVVVCYVGGAEVEEREKEKMHSMGIPVFPSPERAVTALHALVKRYESLMKLQASNDQSEGRRSLQV